MPRHHGIDHVPAHWRISDEGSNRLRDVDGCAGGGLLATTQKPPSGRVEDAIQSRATVTEVDLPERLVTLKDERGREFVVEVPDEVKSLDQVKAGDEVIVSYTTAVAWQVRRAGDAAPGVSEQTSFQHREGGRKARRNTRPLGDADHHHHCDRSVQRHRDPDRSGRQVADDQGPRAGGSAQSPGRRPRRHHLQRSSGDRGAGGREELTARAVRTKPGPFAYHSTVGSTYSFSSGSMPRSRPPASSEESHDDTKYLEREAESRRQRRPTPQHRRAAPHARLVACLQLPRRRDDLPARQSPVARAAHRRSRQASAARPLGREPGAVVRLDAPEPAHQARRPGRDLRGRAWAMALRASSLLDTSKAPTPRSIPTRARMRRGCRSSSSSSPSPVTSAAT